MLRNQRNNEKKKIKQDRNCNIQFQNYIIVDLKLKKYVLSYKLKSKINNHILVYKINSFYYLILVKKNEKFELVK